MFFGGKKHYILAGRASLTFYCLLYPTLSRFRTGQEF
jgi:hypothetical protein